MSAYAVFGFGVVEQGCKAAEDSWMAGDASSFRGGGGYCSCSARGVTTLTSYREDLPTLDQTVRDVK